MQFKIGDQVRYMPGCRGYFAAEVVACEGVRLLIEFSSGMRIACYPDDLDAA